MLTYCKISIFYTNFDNFLFTLFQRCRIHIFVNFLSLFSFKLVYWTMCHRSNWQKNTQLVHWYYTQGFCPIRDQVTIYLWSFAMTKPRETTVTSKRIEKITEWSCTHLSYLLYPTRGCHQKFEILLVMFVGDEKCQNTRACFIFKLLFDI